jgi:hypothetical protein
MGLIAELPPPPEWCPECAIIDDPLWEDGSPTVEFAKWMRADTVANIGLLYLEHMVTGEVKVGWGAYGFLIGAALATLQFELGYEGWVEDLDRCLNDADEIETNDKEKCARESGCWPHRKSTKSAWRGEGTIQMEHNGDNISPGMPVWREAGSGTFTITFKETKALTAEEESQLPQQETITGEGTATMTGTGEFKVIDPFRPSERWVHCTDRWQATVPLSVGGTKEANTLTLDVPPASEWTSQNTLSWSCTGPWASLYSGSPGGFTRLWGVIPSLEVSAEDGATGEGVDESSVPPGTKSKVLWSIRLKALPPEEGGRLPVSRATGHSTPELPDPLLAEY